MLICCDDVTRCKPAEETYTSVSDQLEMSQISNEKLQADTLEP